MPFPHRRHHLIFQYISCYGSSVLWSVWSFDFISISIHLMLRFISLVCASEIPLSRFQYISCYGSSVVDVVVVDVVVVFQYISCYGSSFNKWYYIQIFYISIHLMLRFIAIVSKRVPVFPVFQYISCYGSS